MTRPSKYRAKIFQSLLILSVGASLFVASCNETPRNSVHTFPFSVGSTLGSLDIHAGSNWTVTSSTTDNQYGSALRVCSMKSGRRIVDIMLDAPNGDYVVYASSIGFIGDLKEWQATIGVLEFRIRSAKDASLAISEPIPVGSGTMQIVLDANFEFSSDDGINFLLLDVVSDP